MASQDFIDSILQPDPAEGRRLARAIRRLDEATEDMTEAARAAIRELPDAHPLRFALMRRDAALRAFTEAAR